MGTIDDVKKMQQEGKSQDEINSFLRQRGISEQEAARYITQANIQDAVVSDNVLSPGAGFSPGGFSSSTAGNFSSVQQDYQLAGQGGYELAGQDEMQPSMLPPQEVQEVGEPQYDAGQYAGYQQQDYAQQYQPYQEALSSDVITEIAEQVVSEKLSLLTDKLEKAIDFRTMAEARISNLNERLLRMEQILDKMQIALLHKVGEYVQDVVSLKTELIETQKSFKAISHGHHASHSGHSHGGEHYTNEGKKHRP